MSGQNLVQHFGRIVEGEPQALDATLLLLFEELFPHLAALHGGKPVLIQGVEQVHVEVARAGALQLLLEDGEHFPLLLQAEDGHLIRQEKTFPWMALHQALLHRPLGEAVMIGIGRVKVSEPLLQEAVGHGRNLLKVDILPVSVQDGQPHKAEAEFFCVFR